MLADHRDICVDVYAVLGEIGSLKKSLYIMADILISYFWDWPQKLQISQALIIGYLQLQS